MKNETPTTIERMKKEFDELMVLLPKRVGETPKEILKSWIFSTYTAALREEVRKNARKDLEANMLDGDSVDDCGGAMLSPNAVLEWLDDYLSSLFGDPKEPKNEVSEVCRIHSRKPCDCDGEEDHEWRPDCKKPNPNGLDSIA